MLSIGAETSIDESQAKASQDHYSLVQQLLDSMHKESKQSLEYFENLLDADDHICEIVEAVVPIAVSSDLGGLSSVFGIGIIRIIQSKVCFFDYIRTSLIHR